MTDTLPHINMHRPLPDAELPRDYDRLKAFVVSDVHLNNHPYDQASESENPRRHNFRLFLTRVNEEIRPKDKVLLILNGDILDITGSWMESVMPWDTNKAQVQDCLNRLLWKIMDNNDAIFSEIRKLLEHPLTEVIYVFGNHDGLLQKYPDSQKIVRDFLTSDADTQKRIQFVDYFASEELDLHVEHGHRLDPFNRRESGTHPPVGDVINILMVNRFVELAVTRFREQGYSEGFITKIHSRLHDIEYLRPLALLPVWLDNTAKLYQTHPENEGKVESVRDILIETVSKILLDSQMTRFLAAQLRLPSNSFDFLVRLILRIPAILPMVSFITSKVTRQGHSNKYQYRAAQKINQEQGYRLIVFGHTHIPGVLPLSESAYYFNTGSWKPVINLFKHSKDPVDLEYLNPDVQFNKVERSGIFRLEKSDFTRRNLAEFSLQTIQSGLS